MQSYENVAAGIRKYLANDLLPIMDVGAQIAVGIGARYILAQPDKLAEWVTAQFPIVGMVGAVDKNARTIDVEGLLPAAVEDAKERGGYKITFGAKMLTIPPEDIEKIYRYIMQGGI